MIVYKKKIRNENFFINNTDDKIKTIKEILKQKNNSFSIDFSKLKKDKDKLKNESINEMIISINELKNDKRKDNLLNLKRKRNGEESKEYFPEIEEAFKNLNLNSSLSYSSENMNNLDQSNNIILNSMLNYN